MSTFTEFDITKSKVTREGIGLLLYKIYAEIKGGEKFALTKMIKDDGLPMPQIMLALKECKVVENIGGKTAAAEWKWVPASPPNDLIIERVYNNYMAQLQDFKKKQQENKDKRNGVNRVESGEPAKVSAKADGPPSVFIRERLEVIEDRIRYQIDLMETLCKNLGLKETIGGFKIG
jgi:hypothetical protein